MSLLQSLFSAFRPAVQPTEKPPQTYASSVAEFTRDYRGRHWIAEVKFHGQPLTVAAHDFVGAPNDRFVDQLPGILAQLEALESIAREQVPHVTRHHELTGIADSNDESLYDLSLWFRLGDDHETEEIRYVEFNGFDVVRSWA